MTGTAVSIPQEISVHSHSLSAGWSGSYQKGFSHQWTAPFLSTTYYKANQYSELHCVFPAYELNHSAHLPHDQGDELICMMSSDLNVKFHITRRKAKLKEVFGYLSLM